MYMHVLICYIILSSFMIILILVTTQGQQFNYYRTTQPFHHHRIAMIFIIITIIITAFRPEQEGFYGNWANYIAQQWRWRVNTPIHLRWWCLVFRSFSHPISIIILAIVFLDIIEHGCKGWYCNRTHHEQNFWFLRRVIIIELIASQNTQCRI